ncbi:MAG: DUF3089 domain-containing protein [Chitinophagales bacterium]
MKWWPLLLVFIAQQSLAQDLKFDPPAAPDYGDAKNWAALPFRKDAADVTPHGVSQPSDSTKTADVFFIHPTTYRNGTNWNADVSDAAINKVVDAKPIHYQASAWNGACRVYAPRYRQANIKAFFTAAPEGAKALDVAYEDVRRAFLYYMEHYNHGRPIVIASHSQGSKHARRLLQEFFDTTNLRKQLVCAYVVGWPVQANLYKNIKPAAEEKQLGGIVSWCTYRTGFEPEGLHTFYKDAICVNPVSWTIDTTVVPDKQSKGMVLFKFNRLLKNRVATGIHQGILWAKIDYPMAKKFDNLHIGDINLFWMDIREDVNRRVNYFRSQGN